MRKLNSSPLIILSSLLAIAFILFTVLVVNGQILNLDNYFYRNYTLEVGILYYLCRFMAYLYIPIIFLLIYLFIHFKRKQQKYEMIFLFTSLAGWILSEWILKPIFRIPCPPTYYHDILSKEIYRIPFIHNIGLKETCYPSGHTTSYIVLCGYLLYVNLNYTKSIFWRKIFSTLLIAIILLIGPSRIILGTHWFSDVVAAYLLGFSLLLSIFSLRLFKSK